MVECKETINLSILDFKFTELAAAYGLDLSINLSILDFKSHLQNHKYSRFAAINLSILDFKSNTALSMLTANVYKSIHIGF